MPSSPTIRVAVLYQALDPPVINGICKPKKPGGYRDSGADIAYVLQKQCGITVITPTESPGSQSDEGWCFPDHEEGIVDAVRRGATYLWANTILFAQHPLQTSLHLSDIAKDLRIIGQPPRFVELFDDKDFVNEFLRSQHTFTLPQAVMVNEADSLEENLSAARLAFPIVAKPSRGRGSHGVRVCRTANELESHVRSLIKESPSVILEAYLAGQEGTVTVMPPSHTHPDYWAMPIVVRFNHMDGIAPYNGTVAVTKNSTVLTQAEFDMDPAFARAAEQCVSVAKLLQCKAPIRIDIRRFEDAPKSKFALFDVNMKPNMTGPGRPGREDQASLTAMAAAELGWDYPRLLREILDSACILEELRHARLPVSPKTSY